MVRYDKINEKDRGLLSCSQHCQVADTPMVEGYKPLPNEGPVDPQLCQQYQSVIRSLLYLMLGTQPDITYPVTKMAQHTANPTQEHLNKALYIC